MDQSELLSGDIAWWLLGAAALLMLLSSRFRRARRRDRNDGKHGRSGAPSAPLDDEGASGNRRSAGHAGESEVSEPATIEGDAATDGPPADTNALKLEAARVYMELGDTAGARAMLEQVTDDGVAETREAADAMRRELAAGDGESDDDDPSFDAENLLDLATAYVEIGDAESARRMVERVEQVGSDAQRRQARALLDKL